MRRARTVSLACRLGRLFVIQAVLSPIPLPTERLGYTYIVCTAGGALSFDNFLNGPLSARQSLTPDLRQLSRVFTYTSTATSQFDADVVTKCGNVIEMNVRRHAYPHVASLAVFVLSALPLHVDAASVAHARVRAVALTRGAVSFVSRQPIRSVPRQTWCCRTPARGRWRSPLLSTGIRQPLDAAYVPTPPSTIACPSCPWISGRPHGCTCAFG